MTTVTQHSSADPLVGRTLEGRYRVERRIARGGMSVVYQAVDLRLERAVAVKVMSAALSADPAFSDRFSREARAAARLSHLNAVSVYDQGQDLDTHLVFLVMELVEGRTLRELIREHGRFSPAEAVSIIEPVLSALAAAHRAGIVHRDVKPENILLSDDGVVKVADFGLARAIESDPESTRTGLMMGTVAYCSPEQITKGHADQRSDVYSAGIVLFELLTGQPPFSGESAMNVAYQHVHARVPAPSSLVRGIPTEIDELVVAATDSDPTGRPSDAAEFLAEIADVRSALHLPVVAIAPRERIPYQSADVATTERIASGGPMPPVRGRNVQSTVDMRPGAATTPPPVVVPPKRRRKTLTKKQRARRRGLIALVIVLLLGAAAGGTGWWYASGRYSRVPDLSGETQATALHAIKSNGYKVGSTATTYDHTIPSGDVVSTLPKVGTRLARGKTVNIVISKGKDMVTVPLLHSNNSQSVIEKALKAQGIKVAYADPVFNDTVAAGDFVSATPASGTKVERGYTTVTITLSKGPDWISVPVIGAGSTYAQAATAIKQAGLVAAENDVFNDQVPKGQVILPVKPSDRQVRGGTVTVTVSKGPQWVTVPDIGTYPTVDAATQTLEAAGLNVKVKKWLGGHNGVVWNMDPKAGAQVHPGDTITLTVI